MLLDEPFPDSVKPSEVKRYFRRLLPELRQQANWTRNHFAYIDDTAAPPEGFAITASGTLNPLAYRGICRSPECRVRAADHFARTVGVYADVVTVPDMLTDQLARSKRFTNAELLELATDMLVVRRLEPLIRAGVVTFRNPGTPMCEHHYREFEERTMRAAEALFPQIKNEFAFTWRNDYLEIGMGRLYDPPVEHFATLSEDQRRQLQTGGSLEEVGVAVVQPMLRSTLRSVLADLSSASKIDAALFSSSRLDLLSLNAIEGVAPALNNVEHWEEERSVELPALRELTPAQVLQLRQEAELALPRLREKMLRALGTDTTANVPDTLAELRVDAAEVEAELKSIKPSRGAAFRNVAGMLGITMSVYGFVNGFALPAVALGSLGSLLGLLHASARKDEQDVAKAKSRPGYALLRAREIQHKRHDGG